jgi:hypothetical protein
LINGWSRPTTDAQPVVIFHDKLEPKFWGGKSVFCRLGIPSPGFSLLVERAEMRHDEFSLLFWFVDYLTFEDRLLHLGLVDIGHWDLEQIVIQNDHVGVFAFLD